MLALIIFSTLGRSAEVSEAQIRSTPRKPDASSVATFDAAWNIINDTYFDPNFHGLDWNKVREELRPKAKTAESRAELRSIIEEMLHRLGDSHMALIPGDVARTWESVTQQESASALPPAQEPEGSNSRTASDSHGSRSSAGRGGDLGFDVRLRNAQALVTRVDPAGPAGQAGVKPGWIIQSIADEPVAGLLAPFVGEIASPQTQFMAWGVLAGKLAGNPGSSARLEFLNESDQSVSLELPRRREVGEPTKLGYLPTLYSHLESKSVPLAPGRTVGLVRFNIWMLPVIQALDQAIDQFRQADGIIFDLRGNVGGLGGMILGVSGHFLDEPVSLGTLKMRGNELKFAANPRRVNAAGERVKPFSGPFAILIDDLSLSASEIFAGGMQALGRARVFGERSGGQALPAIWDRLPNGDVLYHAFGDFIISSGRRLEGAGVIPDEVAVTSRSDLLKGQDAPLLAALHWMQQQKPTEHLSATPVPVDQDAARSRTLISK
jgi:carboxyl-terminal processing protease